jgi:hypothetical protein
MEPLVGVGRGGEMSDERKPDRVYGAVIEPPSVPVKGYRVRAEDGQQWIRDPEGLGSYLMRIS